MRPRPTGLWSLWLIGCLTVGSEATAHPTIFCEAPSYDFGTLGGSNVVEHAFKIGNSGDVALTVTGIHTGCGCASSTLTSNTILPGKSEELTIRFDATGRVGPQNKAVYVHSTDPANPIMRLELKGLVRFLRPPHIMPGSTGPAKSRADIYVQPEELAFVITPGKTNRVTRFIAIRSATGKSFRPPVMKMPCDGTVDITPEPGGAGYVVKLTGLPITPKMNGAIIGINVDRSPSLAVPVIVKSPRRTLDRS